VARTFCLLRLNRVISFQNAVQEKKNLGLCSLGVYSLKCFNPQFVLTGAALLNIPALSVNIFVVTTWKGTVKLFHGEGRKDGFKKKINI